MRIALSGLALLAAVGPVSFVHGLVLPGENPIARHEPSQSPECKGIACPGKFRTRVENCLSDIPPVVTNLDARSEPYKSIRWLVPRFPKQPGAQGGADNGRNRPGVSSDSGNAGGDLFPDRESDATVAGPSNQPPDESSSNSGVRPPPPSRGDHAQADNEQNFNELIDPRARERGQQILANFKESKSQPEDHNFAKIHDRKHYRLADERQDMLAEALFNPKRMQDLHIDLSTRLHKYSVTPLGLSSKGKGHRDPRYGAILDLATDKDSVVLIEDMQSKNDLYITLPTLNPGDRIPVHQMIYQAWEDSQEGNKPGVLNHVIQPTIANARTAKVLKSALKSLGYQREGQHHYVFSTSVFNEAISDGIQHPDEYREALLDIMGTDNGATGMRLAINHQVSLGGIEEVKVHVWTPIGKDAGSTTAWAISHEFIRGEPH